MARLSLRSLLVAAVVAAGSVADPALAQDEHAGHIQGKVGEVNFPISCSAPAQQRFNRAVAILHSFW